MKQKYLGSKKETMSLVLELQNLYLQQEQNTHIGSSVEHAARIEGMYDQMEALFNRVVEKLQSTSWRLIVEFGKIPMFFELMANALKKIPLATGALLANLTKTVKDNLEQFWSYFTSLFDNTLDEDQSALKEQTTTFEWVKTTAASVFRTITDRLSVLFLRIVEAMISLVFSAIQSMTGAFFTIVDAVLMQSDEIKHKALEYSFFTLAVLSDKSVFVNQRQVYVEKQLGVLARHFGNYVDQIMPLYKRVDKNKIQLQSSDLFDIFISTAFNMAEDALSWIVQKISWLVTALKQITSSAKYWFQFLIFSVPSMARLLDPYIEEMKSAAGSVFGPDWNPKSVFDQHTLLQQLAQNNNIPAKERELIESVLQMTTETMQVYNNEKKSANNRKWAQKDDEVIASKVKVANLLTYLCTSDSFDDDLFGQDDAIEIEKVLDDMYDTSVQEASKLFNSIDFAQKMALVKSFDSIDNEANSLVEAGGKEEMTPEEVAKLRKAEFEKQQKQNLSEEEYRRAEYAERERQALEQFSRLSLEKMQDYYEQAEKQYKLALNALSEFDRSEGVQRSSEVLALHDQMFKKYETLYRQKLINLGSKFDPNTSIVAVDEETALKLITDANLALESRQKQAKRYNLMHQVVVAKFNMDTFGQIYSKAQSSTPVSLPFFPNIGKINVRTWKLLIAGAVLCGMGFWMYFTLDAYSYRHMLDEEGFPKGIPVREDWAWTLRNFFSSQCFVPFGIGSLFDGTAFADFQTAFSSSIFSGLAANRLAALFVKLSAFAMGSLAILSLQFYLLCALGFALVDLATGRELSDVLWDYAPRAGNKIAEVVVFVLKKMAALFAVHQQATMSAVSDIYTVGSNLFGFITGVTAMQGSQFSMFEIVKRRMFYSVPTLPTKEEVYNMIPELASMLPIGSELDVRKYKVKLLSDELKRVDADILRSQVELAKVRANETVLTLKSSKLAEDNQVAVVQRIYRKKDTELKEEDVSASRNDDSPF